MFYVILFVLLVIFIALSSPPKKNISNNTQTPKRLIVKQDFTVDLKNGEGDAYYLIFDCETDGLPISNNSPADLDWPRMVSLSWLILNKDFELIKLRNYIVKVDFKLNTEAQRIHKITQEQTINDGFDISEILDMFSKDIIECKILVAHNFSFDKKTVLAEYKRLKLKSPFSKNIQTICTMKNSTEYCGLFRNDYSMRLKYPKLKELFKACYPPSEYNYKFKFRWHCSDFDMLITAHCFMKLLDERAILLD